MPLEAVGIHNVSELHVVAKYFNFGDKLEEMLRDRIICSIIDDTNNRDC